MRQLTLPALLLVIAIGLAVPAAAQLRLVVYLEGLSQPVEFVQDPTDPDVQYIVQLGGRIRVVVNGVLQASDFLDLSGVISTGGERGLFTLVFAPDYAASGRAFVNFTNASGDTVVARFTRSTTNPLALDPASRFDLRWSDGSRVIDQPFANHNGGHMAFGPDGYLYIGMGDGGSGGDPDNNAQNPDTLLGKMLRIDVNVAGSHPDGFVVPGDNPFIGFALPAIWAFGLRNPWKFTFDLDGAGGGGTGAMLMGDVGQNAFEEVNYQPAGAGGRNYGWRIREGLHDFSPGTIPAFLPLTDPILEYDHDDGRSITGGYVYRGAALGSDFIGRYFYADFITGRLWSVALTIGGGGAATAATPVEHTDALGSAGNISAFGVDADGELYVLSFNGTVKKLILDDAAGCGPDPFVSLGGGTCIDGNWYPPGYPLPGAEPPPPPSPPPSPGTCTTPDPFVSLGGGTCVDGNWYPPGYPVPGSPPSPPEPPAEPPPDPPSTPGTCTTPDPFVSLGGGTCVNGNWLPPGHPGAGPAPPPPPPTPGGCTSPNPFATLTNVVGVCVGGNWIPKDGIRATGTVRVHPESDREQPVWVIEVDGQLYRPVVLDASFQVAGRVVTFAGFFRTDLAGLGIPIELVSIF